MKCPTCNGLGEWIHPAWAELDDLWKRGWGLTPAEENEFFDERGFPPPTRPPVVVYCPDCGGTGDAE